MLGNRARTALAAVAVAGLIAAGFAAPALADDPPPISWSDVSTTDADGLVVTWQKGESLYSPFGGGEMLDEMLVYRPVIENDSTETRYVGFGTDFVTQGTVEPLWTADPWGAFADEISSIDFEANFWAALPPGGTLDAAVQPSSMWSNGMPSWSGHTVTIFELDAAPVDGATPEASPVASVQTPGRFVPADLTDGDIENISRVLGQRAKVAGGDGGVELFSGVTATVQAQDLTAGDTLELWIAEGLNYVALQITGGGLPVGAIKVGEGTVAVDGTFSATISLPPNLSPGGYQLVAGVRAERYWPAGSYDDFIVSVPTTQQSVGTPAGASSTTIADLPTPVTLDFPATTAAGTTSVTVSGTGPVPSGFQLVGDDRLYYHIDSTASWTGEVTVCIDYAAVAGQSFPPRLYHFDTGLNRWQDITTSQTATQVCGRTTSFSPFTLGYPEPFDFAGFFAPVTMDAVNIAKPGQAVPVKFSLGGFEGLDVVTSARFVIEGTDTNPIGEVIDTSAAGGGGLTYDAASDRYTYVWKTSKAWGLKKGRFELTLRDDTVHSFEVVFKK